jgi:hypothetical protein
MLYFFVWEVLCSSENLISSSAGQAKDQWIFPEENVQLLNLHIIIRKPDDIPLNQVWIFRDKDTAGYNSLLEAHPLDPTSGFNRKDGNSIIDEIAVVLYTIRV